MKKDDLLVLAGEAGLMVNWTDAFGRPQSVSPDSLRSVLSALVLPAHSRAAIAQSREKLRAEASQPSPLKVCSVGSRVSIKTQARTAKLALEDGRERSLDLKEHSKGHKSFVAPQEPGYHTIEFGNDRARLAVAPSKAFPIPSGHAGRAPWGIAVQIYALQDGSTSAFGDFAALGAFAENAARLGADAVAMSPIHALLPRSLTNYSPYSPSNRFFLNPLFAATGRTKKAAHRPALIDWKSAYPKKLVLLKEAFARMKADPAAAEPFSRFVTDGGARLLAHARFEVLESRFREQGYSSWHNWPSPFHDSGSRLVSKIDRSDPGVEFHLFLQWLAFDDLRIAHARALTGGMTIGLIADLAVGIDGDGSHAWSAPDEVLHGVSIGAPPDLLGPDGQNWGLTAFSPLSLRRNGFDSFIATLRATMRHAGGIRIDHAMGMQRLWVIPGGQSSRQGVYLAYPSADLLKLVALESTRHNAIVIAEDLGTVPGKFRSRLAQTGISGMRVLWFERTRAEGFAPPDRWPPNVCALPTTHDLPTIAGWWKGRDLYWRARVSVGPFNKAEAQKQRAADRKQLWKALKGAKVARSRQPRPGQPARVIEGVLRYVASTPSRLALFPLEDVAGQLEQPNLPGTVDEHPNWRRRLPPDVLGKRSARRRLALVDKGRPAR